jgi:chromosome segregation ATPase
MFTKLPTIKMGAQTTSTLQSAMKSAAKTALLVAMFPATCVLAQQPLSNDATAAQAQNNSEVAATQNTINGLADQTRELSGQYAQALAELDSLNKYNDQLQSQVDAQEKEKVSIQTQLTEIETTSREVLPLMDRMVQTLDQFVKADVPFLLEERTKRVQSLVELMGRADVAISEKYRRILEAYQIELDYGRTLSAYEGSLGEGPDARTVQFVQLGRVSLMYQTLDGSETGYWDASSKQWVQAPEYAENIRAALGVARNEGAPDLLRVPVPAPQQAN